MTLSKSESYLKQQIELNRQFQACDPRHYGEQFSVMSQCGLGVPFSSKSVAMAIVSSLLDLQEMLSRC